ncbi:YdcF family protein [Enterococcus sp. 669A]|uniref:YdcF family protein n=1 Tax=Candidatus Enterococcus moelleringii TaxID=2815325 RepID=A0ABS3L7W9_9ENTE|nr:ElyC/SanA/YdcF family protein [Enterococcus sp. 669A]MBO1304549.1 YdcF family protein [Enterococcus sp. 669A]
MLQDLARLVDYLTTFPENHAFESETLLIAGNSIPELTEAAAHFCQQHPTITQIIFAGGIGHGTQRLVDSIKSRGPEMSLPDWENKSEAEITAALFEIYYPDHGLTFHLDTQSTNTGENARFSRDLFTTAERPQSFWLVQDPLLQLRSQVTLVQEWALPSEAIQPVPFEQPVLIGYDEAPHFANSSMDQWWSNEYFLSLVIGEVRRLQDNEEGYGPKGAGFIPHVDVPEEIVASYQRCQRLLQEDVRKV